jgi:hypothetical protein
VTCNRYIPSSTKNINLDFNQDIRLQNWVNGVGHGHRGPAFMV